MHDDIIQSRSVGDFLKAVYTLQLLEPECSAEQDAAETRVTTNALAEMLNISAPSVTDMARRMVEIGLIDYRKYHGVRLTEEGLGIALNLIRRHRLIELYLVEEMGYGLHEVHDEAEVLEHSVSERFIDTIYDKLGHPTHDPHGDPIPSKTGEIVKRNLLSLVDIPLERVAIIRRYNTQNNDVIEHITARGFVLGAEVRVTARDPFDGPVTSRIEDETKIIGHNVAHCIMVEPKKA